MDTKKLAKLFGLPEDATEEQIEEAVKALQEKKPEEPEQKEEPKNTELSAAQARILELEKKQTISEAEKIVDDAIKAGKILPKQKEFAMKMAVRDTVEFQAFASSQPDMLEFGERGSSEDNLKINFAKYEPTATEISVAKSLGTWTPEYRVSLMREKAKADGIEIPADFGKEKKAEEK